jgi:hypothetical protein
MVSGEASAVLIKSLLSTIGVPLSRVSSIIAQKTPSLVLSADGGKG